MAEPCLDAFHDDVESVVDHLFTRGNTPIHSLEGWIISRIAVATVDGHRKRRGRRGALQRARVPRWLSTALGEDRWLVDLAGAIIEWVGVPATAGTEDWPLEVWTERRSTITGDPAGSSTNQVASDVERVLTAMRGSRPRWYAQYIERPMGHKQLPVGNASPTADREPPESAHVREELLVDAAMITIAAAATDAISDALAAGEDATVAIPRILRTLFLGPTSAEAVADLPPGEEPVHSTRQLTTLLADETSLARLVRDVLSIVEGDTLC
jgi:hypothetical protein